MGFGQRDHFVNTFNAAPEGGALGPVPPPWTLDAARQMRDARHEWYRTVWYPHWARNGSGPGRWPTGREATWSDRPELGAVENRALPLIGALRRLGVVPVEANESRGGCPGNPAGRQRVDCIGTGDGVGGEFEASPLSPK